MSSGYFHYIVWSASSSALMIAVLGCAVLTLYGFAKRQRERAVHRAYARMMLRMKLMQQLSEVRRLRRFSRQALDLPGTGPARTRLITRERCNSILNQLRDVHRALTDLAEDPAHDNDSCANTHRSQVARYIASMRQYIEPIIDELTTQGAYPFSLEDSPKLRDFVGTYRQSRYRSIFVRSFHRANSSLSAVLF